MYDIPPITSDPEVSKLRSRLQELQRRRTELEHEVATLADAIASGRARADAVEDILNGASPATAFTAQHVGAQSMRELAAIEQALKLGDSQLEAATRRAGVAIRRQVAPTRDMLLDKTAKAIQALLTVGQEYDAFAAALGDADVHACGWPWNDPSLGTQLRFILNEWLREYSTSRFTLP